MLRGEISVPGRDLLVTARLIMIPKGPASFRPLRIECAIIRLFSAITCDSARPLISPGLRPQQLGGGLSGSVEFGARLLDVGYDQGDTIMSIDVENAFNSLRHSFAFSELLDKAPFIGRLFRWKYGTASVMRDNLGAVIAHSRTGVGQGDPLSSICFALAFQPVLHCIADTVRALETAHNLAHPNAPSSDQGSSLPTKTTPL
jgi:Reverse transcriptase (RNA-dependent DNA polymerase)